MNLEDNKFVININSDIRLWYQDPSVLLTNFNEFIPDNNLTTISKINALARLSLYIALFTVISGSSTKFLSIPIVILLVSLFLGYTEPFNNDNILTDKTENKICQKPTVNNPFMNYTLGDQIDNPMRASACKYDDVKKDIKTKFSSRLYADELDIWGRNITERNFYILPNTRIINDQSGFAKWCFNMYEDGGKCKENGENCLVAIDPRYQRGRTTSDL